MNEEKLEEIKMMFSKLEERVKETNATIKSFTMLVDLGGGILACGKYSDDFILALLHTIEQSAPDILYNYLLQRSIEIIEEEKGRPSNEHLN
jgi:hypothetical protein